MSFTDRILLAKMLPKSRGYSEKDDFVVLTEALQADINRYLAERKNLSPTDPLFASTSNRNKGGRLTTRSVSGTVKKALQNIGPDSERYTAHSLRHTSVTYALMGGATFPRDSPMRWTRGAPSAASSTRRR